MAQDARTGCYKKQLGFTLVELLVTITIIVTLLAVLLPALGRARKSALFVASRSQLLLFGRAFMINVSEDADGQLVSGAFDWYRDGDVSEVGWVNDVIETGLGTPGDLLDPANPHKINEIVLDYAGIKDDSTFAGVWWTNTYGDTSHSITQIPSPIPAIKDLFDQGYNTNYATSWQLVRGDPIRTSRNSGFMQPEDGTGPLCITDLHNRVPLMGTARAGNVHDAMTYANPSSGSIEDSPNSAYWPATTRQDCLELFTGDDARTNGWCTESFCDGMNATDVRTDAPSDPEKTQLHNYHDFWPYHLSKREDILVGFTIEITTHVGGVLPMLWGDGSVSILKDTSSHDSVSQPDGWIGAFPLTLSSTDWGPFFISDSVESEIDGKIEYSLLGVE